ncbi:MAG: hypothetical protein ACYCQI_13260 [Gammaproteobacteria bacterium]
MKLFIYLVMAVFSLGLLSGCANETSQHVKANEKGHYYAPSSAAQANPNANQNNAATTASKMMSPVTQ